MTMEVENLKIEIDRLKNELLQQDEKFGEKRAQFKDLYMKKEQELHTINFDYVVLKKENDKLKNEIKDLESASGVAESIRQEELEDIKKQFNNEISLLNKTVDEKDKKLHLLQSENEDLLERLDEKSQEISDTTKNLLSNIAYKFKINTQEIFKNIQERNNTENGSSDKNDVDILKDIVEEVNKEEVKKLKSIIREAYTKIDALEEQINEYKMLMNDEGNTLKSEDKSILMLDQKRNLVEDSKNSNFGMEKSLRKSVSGDIYGQFSERMDETKLRRNTDIQSLKEFLINSEEENHSSQKTRIVTEKEWSRLQLQLDFLRAKSKAECEMCKNYEDQLQNLQNLFKTKERELQDATEELRREIIRSENLKENNNLLTTQLNDKIANQSSVLQKFSEKVNQFSNFSEQLRTTFEEFRNSTNNELKELRSERLGVSSKLEKIETLYDQLLMKKIQKSREMEAEKIELPTSLEGAQFELLRIREILIELKAANEHLNERIHSSEQFNKEKDVAERLEREGIMNEFNVEQKELENKIEKLESELTKWKYMKKSSDNLEETVRVLRTELDAVKKNFGLLELENKSLKTRLQSLQQELENSESVQKDFVKLSQTLQIQLEALRQEDKELRWQFEEDVTSCSDCKNEFPTFDQSSATNVDHRTKGKHHCRHCGKIFCSSCLMKINQPSGLAGNATRNVCVCKVCHTLLVKDAVPYFSVKQ